MKLILKALLATAIMILVCTGFVASLSLNAHAADSVQDDIQRIERMKDMTPEQRIREREAMHEEMRMLTPEQRAERRKAIREYWEKMPPEERRALREKMHEDFRNMPPEERADHRRKMHERFENMSPQERLQFRRDLGKDMPQPNDYPSSPESGGNQVR